LAIVGYVFVPLIFVPLILHPHWGINWMADVQFVGLAALSLIPNRWLVFSRISFVIFLLLTLSPFSIYLDASFYRNLDVASVTTMIIVFLFCVPLPLSLALSRMRFQRGDKFTYA